MADVNSVRSQPESKSLFFRNVPQVPVDVAAGWYFRGNLPKLHRVIGVNIPIYSFLQC